MAPNRRLTVLASHLSVANLQTPSASTGSRECGSPTVGGGFSGTGPTAHGNAHRPTVTGANGMVACAHPLAAQAGLRVLASGGNAIDAGVAVAAALNVVEPFMSGLGGGGWMQIFSKTAGEHAVIDYCGVSPAAADCRNPSPADPTQKMFDVPGAKTTGPLAPVVPGSPAGWFAVLEKFGTLSALEVFAPAIELAEAGFPLTKFGQRQFPGPAGSAYATVSGFGDVLKQPELGRTYRRLAAGGAHEFYKGDVAKEFAAYMAEVGGLITSEDLASYEPRWLKPCTTVYRGHTISACPPPNHGTQILECLNILEGYPLAEWGHNTDKTLHHFFEAMKRAAADRAVWRTPDAAAGLLAKRYAESRRAGIGERATPSATQAGNFTEGSTLDAGDPLGWYKRYGSTTHFDVVDKDGNALSCTHSLGQSQSRDSCRTYASEKLDIEQ
jgi:gamma-glutamyltranspeptidase/glutathione hydrolase